MILPVVEIPQPLLKTPAHLVNFDAPGLQNFIDQMVETMYHYPHCVGLAAPQVGMPWRVIAVDSSRVDKGGSQHGRVILLNPWIVERKGQKLVREGCMSVPHFTGNVVRNTFVEVHGKDRGGRPVEIKAEGFEAIVFQHELDHLDGKLFLDRVASLDTDVFRRKKYQ